MISHAEAMAALVDFNQCYRLVLNGLSRRALKRHLAMTKRLRESGAIHDPAFVPRLSGVWSPIQLEHAIKQWEAEVAARDKIPREAAQR